MRKIFRNPLPSEVAVQREVRQLAKRYNVPVPRVEFWEQGDGKCEPGGPIYLPKPSWVSEVQPDIRHPVYWLLVAHETAHYIAAELGKVGPQHNNGFYAVLLCITLVWGLPLSAMESEEMSYMPKSLMRGLRAAGGVLEAALIEGASVL